MVRPDFRDPLPKRVGWLLAAVIVLPVTAVVLQQLKLPFPTYWNWVIASLAAIAAASPSAIDLWRKLREPGEEHAKVLNTNLRALNQQGSLQRVGDVGDLLATLDLRPSKIAEEAAGGRPPPYVSRKKDGELRRKLESSPFVLVIGPSKAGKSRSAAEAMRKLRNRRLVVPKTKDSLRELLNRGFDFSDSLVWLDDLERMLDAEALRQLLGEIGEIKHPARPATILATMRSKALESYVPSGVNERPEWLVLKEAETVRFSRMLNAEERKAAHEAYGDPKLDEVLERQGLAEYLAAGPGLVTKLEAGTNPVGRAVTLAAVDWYRVGLARAVPKPTLKRLYPAYLGDDDNADRETGTPDETFEGGLEWAKGRLYETSALLTEEAGGLVPFAYLLDYIEDEYREPIPATTWDVALRAAEGGSEPFAIGEAALSRGELDIAERGLSLAAGRPSPSAGPAAFSLGTLCERRDQKNEAVGWYEKAADAGHVGAMYQRGELARQEEDRVLAGKWYERAAAAGYADAMCRLGELAEERDLVEPERSYLAEAEGWYRRAADLGHVGAQSNLDRLVASRHTSGSGSEARGHRGEDRALRRCRAAVLGVNGLEPQLEACSDADLRALTGEFRQRYADGKTLDDLLPEAFAAVREAASRAIGKRHFDVQLMAGAALHWGMVAEVKDGEGKTLVAVLPAYLNALAGQGVHVVTVNDYLAKRDSEWMGRVYRFLGLEVGVILADMDPPTRRKQYAADITYGTNNEFGFDYLRDNMAWQLEDCVQRGHNYAILDEVDSILIDEARTPLIISGPAEQSPLWYREFAKIAPRLRRSEEDDGGDYEVDEKKKTVGILESGVEKVEDWLGLDNLYDPVNTPLVSFLNNSIKAKELYKKDKDYVVMNGEVLIVDEFTGRIMHGRRYNEGLHQAVEAKEGVAIKDENQTLATITLQNYFRLYDKLAGMTGTAMTAADEFQQIYKLDVVEIPTHKPMIREDPPDLVYQTMAAKFDAVVDDIIERHEAGQPVLVGTSEEKSGVLSGMLKRRGIPHEVLNARDQERAAAIIAQAGQSGAVTVMPAAAGRGVDITLGGNVDYLAEEALRTTGIDPSATDPFDTSTDQALEAARDAIAPRVLAERSKVVDAGGLAVLGTERHELRRADNRLRGRAGRRGDPGESRFYLSYEDDLMLMFNYKRSSRILKMLHIPLDVPVESKFVSRSIRSAQTQVEQQYLEVRKNVVKYDDVLNRQRQVVYGERRKVLEGADLYEQIGEMIDEVIAGYVAGETGEGHSEEWDLDKLWRAFRQLYPISVTIDEVIEAAGGDRAGLTSEFITETVIADAQAAYERREQEFGSEVMREVERRVVLSVLDRKWREHLYEMDYLREAVGLQRDPLSEYQRAGYGLFSAMMDGIKEESVGLLFNLDVQVQENPIVEEIGGASAAVPPGAAPSGVMPPGAPANGALHGAAPRDTAARDAVAGGTAAPGQGGQTGGDWSARRRPQRLQYSAPSVDGGEHAETSTDPGARDGFADIGRNDPCPCGSGLRYKRCHGDPRTRPNV